MKKNTFLSFLVAFCSVVAFSQSEATYTVVFESNWSQATHPHPSGNFPSNAHWSKLVGATHNNQVHFLEMGALATPGIEDIAELGSNQIFFNEVNGAIAINVANNLIEGTGLATGLGEIVINTIVTTEEFPLLSLVSMIAPSPDWIIAVDSVSLLDTDGNWKQSIEIDLFPYDAGTDSGTDYTSANQDTDPKEPIASAQGTSPFSSEKIGTLTITLDAVLGVTATSQQKLEVFPNPTRDILNLTNSNPITTIEVYDVLGKRVMISEGIHTKTTRLDVNRLTNGVYLVKVTDSNQVQTVKKIIKQ